MGNRKICSTGRNHLLTISNILAVVSFIAIIGSITTWINALNTSGGYGYESSSISGVQAFSYVIDSLLCLVGSFVLRGFSFIVKAAVRYLDEKGEFDEKENA